MNPGRSYRLPLVALWLCVAYFVLLTAFFFATCFVAPISLVSDYDPSTMTRGDLMAIAGDFGRMLRKMAVLTGAGAIALLAIVVWIQAVSPSHSS